MANSLFSRFAPAQKRCLYGLAGLGGGLTLSWAVVLGTIVAPARISERAALIPFLLMAIGANLAVKGAFGRGFFRRREAAQPISISSRTALIGALLWLFSLLLTIWLAVYTYLYADNQDQSASSARYIAIIVAMLCIAVSAVVAHRLWKVSSSE